VCVLCSRKTRRCFWTPISIHVSKGPTNMAVSPVLERGVLLRGTGWARSPDGVFILTYFLTLLFILSYYFLVEKWKVLSCRKVLNILIVHKLAMTSLWTMKIFKIVKKKCRLLNLLKKVVHFLKQFNRIFTFFKTLLNNWWSHALSYKSCQHCCLLLRKPLVFAGPWS